MSVPLISILMAVYNAGDRATLDAAVTSILRQDLDDWELLICDDGSTDDTGVWLREWAERDERIRVLRSGMNKRAAAARNCCFREARGTYIAIMDADDRCTPNRLRKQVEFLNTHPEIAFVGLRGERFCKEPGDMKKPYWCCSEPQPKDFLMTLPFVHASLMFRREIFEAEGGYAENRTSVRCEDYDLLLRIYARGHRGANIDDAVYYIRENEGTFRRRKYRYRLTEAVTKWKGFVRVGLMPVGIPYAIKPLIVGLIPRRLLEALKRRYYKW